MGLAVPDTAATIGAGEGKGGALSAAVHGGARWPAAEVTAATAGQCRRKSVAGEPLGRSAKGAVVSGEVGTPKLHLFTRGILGMLCNYTFGLLTINCS